MQGTENNDEILTEIPRDLAEDLRKQHPNLPAVWEGRPGANPAAKHFAWRLARHIKEGREVPSHEMQWYDRYGNALVIRRHKYVIEEEELLLGSQNSTGQASNTELAIELLRLVVQVRKEHADRIDKLTKDYEDRLDKHQERADTQNMEFIKILQKDKESTIATIKSAYSDSSQVVNQNLKAIAPLVEALTKNNVALMEHTGKMTSEYHEKIIGVIKDLQKPGNIELLLMMVVGPVAPILITALLQKLKIPLPNDFAATIGNAIKSALAA